MPEPQTRAGRHRQQSPPRLTLRSMYWHLTRAPRPSLFRTGQDPVREGPAIFVLTLGAFSGAAHDIFVPDAWWAPFRGLALLAGGVILVWLVLAYLGRPVIEPKRPSLLKRMTRKTRPLQGRADEE